MLKNVGQVVLLSELCQKHHKEMVDYLGSQVSDLE